MSLNVYLRFNSVLNKTKHEFEYLEGQPVEAPPKLIDRLGHPFERSTSWSSGCGIPKESVDRLVSTDETID